MKLAKYLNLIYLVLIIVYLHYNKELDINIIKRSSFCKLMHSKLYMGKYNSMNIIYRESLF
jgi:hypothetical protein